MPLATISLPEVHLVSKKDNLELVLQGSLSIRIPAGSRKPRNSDELLALVLEEHLWLVRAGSCHFTVSMTLHGEPLSEVDQVSQVAEWIRLFEFWDLLGLRLQVCDSQRTSNMEPISFSIQHPNLSSSLVAPTDAFTAEFQQASCSINISRAQKQCAPQRPTRKRRRREQRSVAPQRRDITDICGQDEADDDIYRSLAPADRQAIDEFMLGLGYDPGRGQGAQRVEQDLLGLPKPVDEVSLSENVPMLLELALKAFVMGIKKTYKGIKITDGIPAQALTRLAPAVFHFPYLEVVSGRAALLPVIAMSLARMRNAESIALRGKVTSLQSASTRITRHSVANSGPADTERLIAGIEKMAWNVLLANIKTPPPPRLTKPVAKRESQIDSDDGNHTGIAKEFVRAVESPNDATQTGLPVLDIHLSPMASETQSHLFFGATELTNDYDYPGYNHSFSTRALRPMSSPHYTPYSNFGVDQSPDIYSDRQWSNGSSPMGMLRTDSSLSFDSQFSIGSVSQQGNFEAIDNAPVLDPGGYATLEHWLNSDRRMPRAADGQSATFTQRSQETFDNR